MAAVPVAFPLAPRYMVSTHGSLEGLSYEAFQALLLALFDRYTIRFEFSAPFATSFEVWLLPSHADFARGEVHVYTTADGRHVYEVTKATGSGTLIARLFQAIKASCEGGGPAAAPASLQPPPRAAASSQPPPTLDTLAGTLNTIVSHLDKPAYDLVLHAVQYFAVLAQDDRLVGVLAQYEALIAALFRTLDPARKLPDEICTAALGALSVLANVRPAAILPLRTAAVDHWRAAVAAADLRLSLYEMRAVLAASVL